MGKRSNSMPEIGKTKPPNKPQTIFIHKLYDMLLDTTINHLIWWHARGDSFFIIPNEEFSKVLSSFFKHTNIASFIRQLNMYGFHKVNDSNDNAPSIPGKSQPPSPPPVSEPSDHKVASHDKLSESIEAENKPSDSNEAESKPSDRKPSSSGNKVDGKPQNHGKDLLDKHHEEVVKWEFKHSNGQFKRGDIESLKLIKRRSSKNISKEIVINSQPDTPSMGPSSIPGTPGNISNIKANGISSLPMPIAANISGSGYSMAVPNYPNHPGQPYPTQPTQIPSHNPQSQPSQEGGSRPHDSGEDLSSYHQNLANSQFNLQNSISIDKYLELLNNFNNMKYELSNLHNKFDYFISDYKFQQKNLIKLIEILQSNNLNDLSNFKHVLINNLNESIISNESFLKGGVQYYPLNPYYSLRSSNSANKSVSIGPEQPMGTSNQPSLVSTQSQQQPQPSTQGYPPFHSQPHHQAQPIPTNQPHVPYQPTTAGTPIAQSPHSGSPHHQGPNFSPFPTSVPYLPPHVQHSQAQSSSHPTSGSTSQLPGQSGSSGPSAPQNSNVPMIGPRGSRSYSPMSKDYFPAVDPPTPRNSFDGQNKQYPASGSNKRGSTPNYNPPMPSNLTPQTSSNSVPYDETTSSINHLRSINQPSLNQLSQNTVTASTGFGLGITQDKEKDRLPSVSELDKSIQDSKEKRKGSEESGDSKKIKFN